MNTITLEAPAKNAPNKDWAAYGKQQAAAEVTRVALKPSQGRIMQVDPKKVVERDAAKVAAGNEPNTPTLFIHVSVTMTVKEAEAALKAAKKAESDVISVEGKGNGWRNKVTEMSSVCARFQGIETDALRRIRKEKAEANGNSDTPKGSAL